jgi:soluble lytic murein transglycosylase-like protein
MSTKSDGWRMIQIEPREHHAAVKIFRNHLSIDDRLSVAKEIVKTRSDELCRAYKNLIGVSCGYRIKSGKQQGDRKLLRKPCVIFVVDGKWEEKQEDSDQALPAYLYAFWQVGDRRRLCAVPTDVDDVSDYAAIEPQSAPGGIEVPDEIGSPEPGCVACAVERSSQANQSYLISARHVLSLSEKLHPVQRNSEVRLRTIRDRIGKTLQITGTLQDQPAVSLDAQLAKVVNLAAARQALGAIRFSAFAAHEGDIPDQYWVLTPRGAIKLKKRQVIGAEPPINYHRDGIREVIHEELVESVFGTSDTTISGDSGSPVATNKSGGVLLGMHIAGSNARAYAIPAWQLLSPKNYQRAAASETWRLLNPDELEIATAAAPAGIDPLPELLVNHRFNNSVVWRLASDGLRIADASPEITQGPPQTVDRVWQDFGTSIQRWAGHFDVPVELIIATICTESGGRADAVRQEPGYLSDQTTPNKVSAGLMQTLISTARETLRQPGIDRTWLLDPDNSIRAGTAYIDRQRTSTALDPPKVACAYNAGSLRPNDAPGNRWKMRQFPRDTSQHADRFVAWFNDCFRLFRELGAPAASSFFGRF